MRRWRPQHSILIVDDNHLRELPPLAPLGALKSLSASCNVLEHLPPSFTAALPLLTYLDLSMNRLRQLPADMGALSHLQVLKAGANDLTSLPSSVGQLASLRELLLPRNCLGELPATIGRLPRLESLVVACNRLWRLPASVGGLGSLQVLPHSLMGGKYVYCKSQGNLQ